MPQVDELMTTETVKTAFESIEEALREATPTTTFNEIRKKAKVSNGALQAYLKLKGIRK